MRLSTVYQVSFYCLLSMLSIRGVEVGVKAEWDKPQTIIMHTPGPEVFYGTLHANAALFEQPFDSELAASEHRSYINTLATCGIKVVQVVDVLLKNTLQVDGMPQEGQALDELRQFAATALTYKFPEQWSQEQKNEQMKYHAQTLRALHPKNLVKIILERPTIELEDSIEGNTKLVAKRYTTAPLMNMHFLRDQQITTDRGVVIGNMNSCQRKTETDITEFVFTKLGAKPLYRVQGSGRLEGGDYIPAGEFALIGCGLRTNEEGIHQLFHNKVFNFPEIAVVKDPFKHQDQMHLDTYFNIIGSKKALVDTIRRSKEPVMRDGLPAPRPIRPSVDVYLRQEDGSYTLSRSGIDFFAYIEVEKGFQVIDISDEEQLRYGCNFLCVGEDKIVGVKGVGTSYEQRLKDNGVDAHFVEFGNVTKSYGGPHCTTQVISRKAN